MTDLLIYKQIVEGIFGADICSLDTNRNSTNNVIGALAIGNDYQRFHANFIARLRRLNEIYYPGHPSRAQLLKKISDIGTNTWQGATAELAAIDFYTSRHYTRDTAPALDAELDESTLAQKFGRQTDLDIHFQDYGTYTDVKVLKDNVTQILEGICFQIWPDYRQKPILHHEYPLDSDYLSIARNRDAIVSRIRNKVADGTQPRIIDCSDIVPKFKIRLGWNGFLATEHSYNPFRHAREIHPTPLIHAKKFCTDAPFFLTFVVFPWYNNTVSGHGQRNEVFYRALARRVFLQYKHSQIKFSDWYRTHTDPRNQGNYRGSETVFEVSLYLGGIMFLEDKSIESTDPDQTNVAGYYYENPNAYHKPMDTFMYDYLRSLTKGHYETFEHDNY